MKVCKHVEQNQLTENLKYRACYIIKVMIMIGRKMSEPDLLTGALLFAIWGVNPLSDKLPFIYHHLKDRFKFLPCLRGNMRYPTLLYHLLTGWMLCSYLFWLSKRKRLTH